MIYAAICRQCAAENRGSQRSCLICGTPLPLPGITTTKASAAATPATVAKSAAAAPAAAQQPVNAPTFCTGCGAPLRPGRKFCTKCGKSAI